MARIRTIKPDFFRHEVLQDLEAMNPESKPMLVFIALWGHCDKNGIFEWKPRQLKLDILPFISFNMDDTLEILRSAGLILKLVEKGSNGEATGKQWGSIPTFTKHQRINGKESQEESKFPNINQMVTCGEVTGKQQGSNREATGTTGREGKGREGKGDNAPILPEEALRLSGLLANLILTRNPLHTELVATKKEKTVIRWAGDIDKLNRIDGQSWDRIEAVILWCQKDKFWQNNILSGIKLREQFNALAAKSPVNNNDDDEPLSLEEQRKLHPWKCL